MNCVLFECIHAKPSSQWNPSFAMKCWEMWIDECNMRYTHTHSHIRYACHRWFIAYKYYCDALYAIWSKWRTSKDETLYVGEYECALDLRFAYVQNSMEFKIAQKKQNEKRMNKQARKKHSENITHCSLSRLVSFHIELRMCVLKNSRILLEFNANWTIQIAIDFCIAIIKFHWRINDIVAWFVQERIKMRVNIIRNTVVGARAQKIKMNFYWHWIKD